jgi:hypothetical protein
MSKRIFTPLFYVGWCEENKQYELFSQEQVDRKIKENPTLKIVESPGPLHQMFEPSVWQYVDCPHDKVNDWYGGGFVKIDKQLSMYELVAQFPHCSC